ncbi:MAG TPA: hypothetical protein VLL25_04005 [Acidimicrobiales bacterium]|nr:hypothetical protein [Acidimicrobiales bacterium]
MTAADMAADIVKITAAIGDIEAQVADLESQIESRTLQSYPLYVQLVETVGGGLRSAARQARDHDLRYADPGSLRKLLRWGELCEAVKLLANGGVDYSPHPSWGVIYTPIVANHLWHTAGADKLAELWLSLPADLRGPKAFAKAADARWPKDELAYEVNAAIGRAQTAIRALDKSAKPTLIPELLAGVRKSDHLAKYLCAAITARWGSVEAFAAKYPTKPTSD